MNLEELRTVRRKERQKDSLQHLRDSFYTDVAAYLEDLKAQRRRAAESADDPFASPEVSRLTDEIETAEEVVEAVYERRVGKVVKLSSFAAADMNTDEEGLTDEEHELFDDLVGRIKRNRSTVLDILAGEGTPTTGDDASAPQSADADATPDTGTGPGVSVDVSPGDPADGERLDSAIVDSPATEAQASDSPADDAPTPPPDAPEASETSDTDTDNVLADAMGGTGDSKDSGGPDAPATESTDSPRSGDATVGDEGAPSAAESRVDAERTTVRITRDVGRIFGVDEREYELADEDVVRLPTPNAKPLLDRDAAERLD